MKYSTFLTDLTLLIASKLRDDRGKGHRLSTLSDAAFKSLALASTDVALEDDPNLQELDSREVCYSLYWRNLRREPEPAAFDHYSTMRFPSRESVIARNRNVSASPEVGLKGRFDFKATFSSAGPEQPSIYLDVTNTIDTGANTGIQRVVRGLSSAMRAQGTVKYCYFSLVRRRFVLLERMVPASDIDHQKATEISFRRGDIFFDIDSSWGDRLARQSLYPTLKGNGVLLFVLHYDAVPIIRPYFSHSTTVLRYAEHFAAVLTYADHVFCISETVRSELQRLCEVLGGRYPSNSVIEMGFDLDQQKPEPDSIAELEIAKGPYVLCVGTVEPRKNYRLVMAHLDAIRELGLRVVIVGKRGWETPEFLADMEARAGSAGSLTWFRNATDNTLRHLYANATVLVVPSFYEGFGLPVIEGLAHGRHVLVSNGGALAEALGTGRGRVFDLDQPGSFLTELQELLVAARFPQKSSGKTKRLSSRTWDSAAATVLQRAKLHWDSAKPLPDKLPLVYLSIRPDNLRRSIGSMVANKFPIASVTVLTSARYMKDMKKVARDLPMPVTIIDENELASGEIVPEDHLERNYILRKLLYASLPATMNKFVSLDDDAILLKPLSPQHFYAQERYSYFQFFGSLSRWKSGPFGYTSSFDEGQWAISDLLNALAYRDDGFAAHRPQLINASWFAEVASEFQYLRDQKLDEWSPYFNVVLHRYPFAGRAIRSTVIGWPERISSWKPDWFCDDSSFHNLAPGDHGVEINIEQRRLAYAQEYNLYHFQRMLCDGFDDALTQLTVDTKRLVGDGHRLYALKGIWRPLPVAGIEVAAFGYVITQKDVVVVDGRIDIQTIHRRTNLMIRLPGREGLYRITIQGPADIAPLSIELVVLPCASA